MHFQRGERSPKNAMYKETLKTNANSSLKLNFIDLLKLLHSRGVGVH